MYQDSFIKAMQHLDSFDSSKSFGPWMNTIIVNTCKNYLEKMHPDYFGDLSSEDLDFVDTIENSDIDMMPEESLDMKEMTVIMDGIMDELPDAQRQAMVLYYYKQMSVAEIAKVQNVPVDSVKSRLNYGRKKVAEGVEKYQKKSGIKLFAMVPVLLTLYFKMDTVARAETIVDTVDTGINVAEAAMETADNVKTARKAAKTAGKMLGKHMAKKTILKASSAVIATGAIGGAAYVYETQVNVEATDESLFEWNESEITAYVGDEANIVIPAKTTSIAEKAFQGNTNIHSVDFSQSEVKRISKWAFKGCSMLSEVNLPDSLETIGFEAFYDCDLIGELVIPKNVRVIDAGAWESCNSLSKVKVESSSISKCDSNIFKGCSLSEVIFSEDMTFIPGYLFYNADFMPEVKVEIPKKVVSIGDSAFYSELGKGPSYVEFLGDQLTDIARRAFFKCELKDLYLPDSLEFIGFQAFAGCENISKVTIPNNVHRIDGAAFENCVELSELVINSTTIHKCDTNIFDGCSLSHVVFNENMEYIPAYLFYNASFIGDVTLEIPKNVKVIKEKAFFSDRGKSPVKFIFNGNVLDEIERQAFYKCEMDEIILTAGIEKIGFDAFGGCDKCYFKVVPGSFAEEYLQKEGFEQRITYVK